MSVICFFQGGRLKMAVDLQGFRSQNLVNISEALMVYETPPPTPLVCIDACATGRAPPPAVLHCCFSASSKGSRKQRQAFVHCLPNGDILSSKSGGGGGGGS